MRTGSLDSVRAESVVVPIARSTVIDPPIVVLNTIGALWGFLSPTRSFAVTPKVTAQAIETEHPDFGSGELPLEDHVDRELSESPLDPRKL